MGRNGVKQTRSVCLLVLKQDPWAIQGHSDKMHLKSMVQAKSCIKKASLQPKGNIVAARRALSHKESLFSQSFYEKWAPISTSFSLGFSLHIEKQVGSSYREGKQNCASDNEILGWTYKLWARTATNIPGQGWGAHGTSPSSWSLLFTGFPEETDLCTF